MGSAIKFNWVLQLSVSEEPVAGNCYEFTKVGNRVFPIETPIDLIDLNRNAIAKIRIKNFQNLIDRTVGEYQVIKVYSGIEKEVLTNYWVENEK